MAKPGTYRAFLLTAWAEERPNLEGDIDAIGHWRFGLEDARGTQRRRVFNTLQEVVQHVTAELGKED